jgi:hypothetical protein
MQPDRSRWVENPLFAICRPAMPKLQKRSFDRCRHCDYLRSIAGRSEGQIIPSSTRVPSTPIAARARQPVVLVSSITRARRDK